jgi:hypothetical protein
MFSICSRVSETQDIPRELEMLGKAAEMELALAQEYFSRARASGEVKESTAYAAEFRKLTRSMRLSIALREKMVRGRARDEREAPAPPPKPRTPEERIRIDRRKRELHEAVARVVWREADSEDREWMFDILRDNLWHKPHLDDSRYLDDDGLDGQVLVWCEEFGLPLDIAQHWRDLPPAASYAEDDEDEDEDDEEPEPESSA